MQPEAAYTIVCPGCGWVGTEEGLEFHSGSWDCPDCEWQNRQPPFRLLTVKEMMEFPQEGEYRHVDMYAFLNSIAPYLQNVSEGG